RDDAVSRGKDMEGVSVGAEVSYGRHMPAESDAVNVLPAPLAAVTPGAIATTSVPSNGDAPGALGNTWHGLVNGLYTLPSTPLFDTANIAAELAWMHLDTVTQNPAVYKGRASYSAIDKPTSTFVGMAATFTPTWLHVWPGGDLTLTRTWTHDAS